MRASALEVQYIAVVAPPSLLALAPDRRPCALLSMNTRPDPATCAAVVVVLAVDVTFWLLRTAHWRACGAELLSVVAVKVNKNDFLQIFQVSGIEKMADNSTSVEPLSYTTNGSRVDLVSLVSVS